MNNFFLYFFALKRPELGIYRQNNLFTAGHKMFVKLKDEVKYKIDGYVNDVFLSAVI